MNYLQRRLRSFFFWGLSFLVFLWYDAQPKLIENEVRRVQLEIDDARTRIANGEYIHEELCRDGWPTPSSGQGRCSWHGGVDRDYPRERAAAFNTASRDIHSLRRSLESRRDSRTFWLAAFIFLFAPLLDLIVFRRKQLYPEWLSTTSQPAQTKADQQAPASLPESPTSLRNKVDPTSCPSCGSKMVLRVAGRGRNRGKPFLGCSRFPHCRGTRPHSTALDRTRVRVPELSLRYLATKVSSIDTDAKVILPIDLDHHHPPTNVLSCQTGVP